MLYSTPCTPWIFGEYDQGHPRKAPIISRRADSGSQNRRPIDGARVEAVFGILFRPCSRMDSSGLRFESSEGHFSGVPGSLGTGLKFGRAWDSFVHGFVGD